MSSHSFTKKGEQSAAPTPLSGVSDLPFSSPNLYSALDSPPRPEGWVRLNVRPHMIFNCLDFHVDSQYGEEPIALSRPFRLSMNYIVDSFSMRIPKKIKTVSFHKLNVCVRYQPSQRDPFYAMEGIGYVEIVDPNIASIYQAPAPATAERVKGFLREGLRIAAKGDVLFAGHLDLWDDLLSTVDEEFDFDLRMSRSHRSRRWVCEAVMRITPTAYHYDVLVKDSKTGQTIQRYRVKTTEALFPFFRGVGFSKTRWDGGDIVGLSKDDKEMFRFHSEVADHL